MKFRFHVPGLPHTVTGSSDFSACAYTGKVGRFCKMMRSLGHDVFHYGAEGSEVDCTEHVPVISNDEQERFFGPYQREKSFPIKWDPKQTYWELTNGRVAAEINRRKQRKDFVCLVGGSCQKLIADLVGELDTITCEPFVGYYGIFSKYRVYESYTHQSAVYGMRSSDPDGCLYDAVIPNYYDPDDFPIAERKKDYLLYMGRLIRRKGLQIVLDVAARTGRQLILAGQGVVEHALDRIVTEEGMTIPLNDQVHYFGTANVGQRSKLMSEARAVVMPTLFMEPFGGVAVEAQMSGTAVLCSDHAAFSETVIHGLSGYRCHTLEQFCWAAENVTRLAPPSQIRARAVDKYSTDRVRWMYQEYFSMLYGLWDKGWYATNPARDNLDWLGTDRCSI